MTNNFMTYFIMIFTCGLYLHFLDSQMLIYIKCKYTVATSLFEPVQTICQLSLWQHTTMKFESKYKHYHLEMHWKRYPVKCRSFGLGLDMFINVKEPTSLHSNIAHSCVLLAYIIWIKREETASISGKTFDVRYRQVSKLGDKRTKTGVVLCDQTAEGMQTFNTWNAF